MFKDCLRERVANYIDFCIGCIGCTGFTSKHSYVNPTIFPLHIYLRIYIKYNCCPPLVLTFSLQAYLLYLNHFKITLPKRCPRLSFRAPGCL